MTEQERGGKVALLLRRATGVDEDILDGIATERTRYTAMGGVVIGTALIAMFSMSVALAFVFDGFPPYATVFVLLWGAFVFSVDRWLMASAAGVRAGERIVRLLPRLVLAAAVGVVVAEPLVLVAFDATVVERAAEDRKNVLLTLESDLLACNPVPGTAATPAGPRCEGRRLAVAEASAEGKQGEIAGLTAQIASVRATVQRDSKALADLEAEAAKECNGTDGPGLSGRFGVGPSCRRLRDTAEQYRTDHRIKENIDELAALESRIGALTGTIGKDADTFVAARKTMIAREVAEARDRQRDLGLLERMRTLGLITADNGYARAGEWALRIFLILIDSLPVLVKMLGGVTTYDQIVADRLSRQKRSQFEVNQALAERDSYGAKLLHESYLMQFRAGRERVRWEAMRERRAMDTAMHDEVERRTLQIIGEAPTLSMQITAPPETVAEPPPVPHQAPAAEAEQTWQDRPSTVTWGDR
ncbi:DUF4407 domain-containing protein [Actinoplanes sp. M2I2]|uniref:DUF4407 domain-containing protein n=1 Tax=Actinoplanes sp. M2I2 TaxID=1734444 RepID=UPI0020211567|nr:DUF4407 domain-containing protein [Actinoplanes sp. M2I2]